MTLERIITILCAIILLAALIASIAGANGLIGLFLIPAALALPLFLILALGGKKRSALVIYALISALWLAAGARLFLMPLGDYEGLWAVIVWPSQQFTIVAAGIGWIAGRWWLRKAGT